MYGKHFESMYDGSMYGAGLAVFAVWGYVISHARAGKIELNPKKLSDTLGGTIEEITGAIEYLCKPDPQSRHKSHDGRRMVKDGVFQFLLPSWEDYQKIKSEEERREYNRLKQREYRANEKPKKGGLGSAETGVKDIESWVDKGTIMGDSSGVEGL